MPGWISDTPKNGIIMGTKENSQIGSYPFYFVATDSISGLSN